MKNVAFYYSNILRNTFRKYLLVEEDSPWKLTDWIMNSVDHEQCRSDCTDMQADFGLH